MGCGPWGCKESGTTERLTLFGAFQRHPCDAAGTEGLGRSTLGGEPGRGRPRLVRR